MLTRHFKRSLFGSVFALSNAAFAAGSSGVDDITHQLAQLSEQLNTQQQQIQSQAAGIAAMQQRDSYKGPQKPSQAISVSYETKPADTLPALVRASTAPNTVDVPVPQVVFKGQAGQFSIDGLINTLFMYADDGEEGQAFITSAPPLSRLTFTAISHPEDDFNVGARVQLGFNINQSSAVSQDQPSPGQRVDIRIGEIFFRSKQLGKLSLGKGLTASDNIAYADFSGTAMLGRATLQDIGGGLFFRDAGTDELSTTKVGNVINGLDGFGRRMRVRYDSPSMGGLMLATSFAEGTREDLALKFGRKFSGMEVASQVAVTSHQTVASGNNVATGNVYNASAGIMLDAGLNLSASYAKLVAKEGDRNNPNYYYIKPGFKRQIFNVGTTAFSVDYGRYFDFLANSSVANGYGVQLAQNIDRYNLAVYAGYRNFALSGTNEKFDNIRLFLMGALIKF